jgi:hypothetical protein
MPIGKIFGVFEKTYPERKAIFDKFGLNFGLNGVRLPDALVLERRKNAVLVSAFCEHSLNSRSLKEKSKYYACKRVGGGFVIDSHLARREELKRNLAQYLRESVPELPARILFNSRFGIYYAVPKKEAIKGRIQVPMVVPPDKVFVVPVTCAEISRVVAGIVSDLAIIYSASRFVS